MSRSIQGPFGIVATQAIYDQNLSPAEFRVLAALASFAGQGKFGEWCAPKQTELAEELGLARQTVSTAVKRLVELGYLVTRAQTSSGNGKTGLEYYVRRDFHDDEPMSTKSDTGLHEGNLDAYNSPMSAKADVRADVSATRQPMSANPDIPHSIEKNLSKKIVPPKAGRSAKSKSQEEARRFWDDLRPHLSAYGKSRGKPIEIDRLLPPLIKTYGYDLVWKTTLKFYKEAPDCRRGDGEGQPGLQVLINDGRLESLLRDAAARPEKPAGPPTKDQIWEPRYREWLKTDGLIWDYQRWGPAPNEPGHLGPKKARAHDFSKPAEQGVAA